MLAAEFHKLLQNPDELNVETLSRLKELVSTKPAFQLAWMLLLKNLKILNSPDFEVYLAKAAFYITDRRKLYHFLMVDTDRADREMDRLSSEYASSGGYQLEPESESRETLSDLVKSLRKKTSVPPDDEQMSEEKEAESSDSSVFVTETLAKIYVRQGMYKQAILAYEKLSLKYPEKNIYFAGQIDEVKKLMN
ncbi:hypothetical protein [Mangrovibacterium sp.]|uniref:hypothetical protein n=1 Tax=Mangrovibacterium sp. TaxID=1961364 RepID=UPI00356807D8